MGTNNFMYSKANDLRELVELNDYLKSLYRDDSSVNFPSIVVLGAQSDGKTSLIENLTNLNLPRGTGIQTRVPTEIQLRNSKTNHYTIKYRPYGSTDYKVVEFSEETLEDKMRIAQREVTGSETRVMDDLIILTIERPDLVPLTIVDLPGFFVQRISEEGNEVDDEAENMMKKMYIKYISNEANQIVCCLSASSDVETSSVFKLCMENDPTRRRIILAVTKIDLRVSNGFENYRKAAYKFGVKKVFFTRSKTDEEREQLVKPEEVREREKKFIREHKELKGFPEDTKGIIALREFMVEVQKDQIVPSIRNNYSKLIDFYKHKLAEQELKGQLIEKPKESKQFIEKRIDEISEELHQLYYDLNTKIETDNFYQKEHKVGDHSKNEVTISVKKVVFNYQIIPREDGIQLIFSQGAKEHIQVELLGANQHAQNVNVDLERPEPVDFENVDFTISLRLLGDKDFIFYRKTAENIYTTFRKNFGLDYFLSEHFVQVYENNEKAINTTNNLPDRDFSELAESILFKDLVPKLTYEIEAFKEFAVRFAQQVYTVRINAVFKGFPNLRAVLNKEVEKYFAEPVSDVSEVVQVLCENCFKTNTWDAMYLYKLGVLNEVFVEGSSSANNDFLQLVCGEHNYSELAETFRSNERVYKNAIRVWAYVSNIFPSLKDNVFKTVQNHLIQTPMEELPKQMKKLLDKDFFQNEANLTKLMRPNAVLLKQQRDLVEEIQKAANAIMKIKTLPDKYPTLKKDFDFINNEDIASIATHIKE
jgi:GTPase SAR1 family protein